MRIRTIKPEFWRSDDITALSIEGRLLFIGLWSYVDDNGVGVDDEKVIAADLFAKEDDLKKCRALVSRAIRECASRALVTRYTVSGKHFLHITNWEKHQKIDRPSKPRYPSPDHAEAQHLRVVQPPLDESSRQSRDSLDAGTGEQGNRGTKNICSTASSTTPKFDEFWTVYPRRVGKQAAIRRWDALMQRGVDPDRVIAGATQYAAASRGTEPKFLKFPEGWLNAGRWEDEALAASPRPSTPWAGS